MKKRNYPADEMCAIVCVNGAQLRYTSAKIHIYPFARLLRVSLISKRAQLKCNFEAAGQSSRFNFYYKVRKIVAIVVDEKFYAKTKRRGPIVPKRIAGSPMITMAINALNNNYIGQ